MYRLQPEYIPYSEKSETYNIVQEIINYNLQELLLTNIEICAYNVTAKYLEEKVILKMGYDEIYQMLLKKNENDLIDELADYLPETFRSLFPSEERFKEFGVKKYFELLNIVCNPNTNVTPDIIGEYIMSRCLEDASYLSDDDTDFFVYRRSGKEELQKRDIIYASFIEIADELEKEEWFESSKEKIDWIKQRVNNVYNLDTYALNRDNEWADGLGPLFWDDDFTFLEEREGEDILAFLSSGYGNSLGYNYEVIKEAFDSVGVTMPVIERKIPQLNDDYKKKFE